MDHTCWGTFPWGALVECAVTPLTHRASCVLGGLRIAAGAWLCLAWIMFGIACASHWLAAAGIACSAIECCSSRSLGVLSGDARPHEQLRIRTVKLLVHLVMLHTFEEPAGRDIVMSAWHTCKPTCLLIYTNVHSILQKCKSALKSALKNANSNALKNAQKKAKVPSPLGNASARHEN